MHADSTELRRIQIIDSHTGGEPTRVVIAGGPGLLGGSVSERRTRFSEQFDQYRTALCGEPRGSDVLVGALLVEPEDKRCVCGVIFFNNVGCLGMCGHGIIGVVTTLAYLGKLQPGVHRIETPVGVVWATLHDDGRVSVRNVASYRSERAVALTLPSGQRVTGDIAWGGNWFFLCADHGEAITAGNVARLTALSGEIRRTLNQTHPEIDHIELFGPPGDPANHSRSFVLCPGGAYDRSPCGTGTSAKLACLAADGKLAPGEVWRQESVIGSVFEGCIELAENGVIPTITGRAWISAETTLLLDESDPFCWGIPSP